MLAYANLGFLDQGFDARWLTFGHDLFLSLDFDFDFLFPLRQFTPTTQMVEQVGKAEADPVKSIEGKGAYGVHDFEPGHMGE